MIGHRKFQSPPWRVYVPGIVGSFAFQLLPRHLQGQVIYWLMTGFFPSLVILLLLVALANLLKRERYNFAFADTDPGPEPGIIHMARPRSVEDRLDELDRLKRRDVVTPEEYAAKRQEILKEL